MRLVIDLQAAQGESRVRGIGRYSLSLAIEMAREGARRKHEVLLVFNDQFPASVALMRQTFSGVVPQSKIKVFSVPARLAQMHPENEWRARAAELVREQYLADLQPDIVHIASLFDGWLDDTAMSVHASASGFPTAVTCYDLIPLMHPELYLIDPGYKAFYMRRLANLKRADFLLAISDYSRTEAIAQLGTRASRVVDISAAVDSSFTPQHLSADASASLLAQFDIKRPFVFYVPGGFDPRKNFQNLLQAFATLPVGVRRRHQLVIGSNVDAGIRAMIMALSKSAGLKADELILTGYVTDSDLLGLYSLCELHVFPSLHEGFGLPALEAMACGAPVIGSRATSLPQVIGYDEALFDPHSVADISALMGKALADGDFRQSLREHSLKQAAKFSWHRSAVVAINALEARFGLGSKKPHAIRAAPTIKQRLGKIERALEKIALAVGPADGDMGLVTSSLIANHPPVDARQLLVDISELVNRDAKSGIQRVVRSILKELLAHPPTGWRVEPVYSADGNGYRYARAFTSRFAGGEGPVAGDSPIVFDKGDKFLGLDLNAGIFPAINPTLAQFKSAGVKVHFVVYDLTPLLNFQWHHANMKKLFLHWVEALARYADGLVCISDAVACDVKSWLKRHPVHPVRKVKIGYFHLGADISGSVPTTGIPESAENVFDSMAKASSFLMVGTVEPRKGYAHALAAFELLWAKGEQINLVIVGKIGWNVEELVSRLRGHPELDKRLHWLEGVSDEYLEAVYDRSTALLAASQAEGFGLPLIEAAQKGLPILARDLPVFREVAGKHAVYFKGEGATTLARAVRKWLDDHAQGKVLGSEKMPWLTWEQSTSQLLRRVGIKS